MAKTLSAIIGSDYQAVFDASPNATFILGSLGQILNASRSAINRYGFSREELLQMNISDLAAPDVKIHGPAKLGISPKSGEMYEWRFRSKDGNELQVEIFLEPIILNGKPVYLARIYDISRSKILESELQNKQHLLERILNTEPGTVYIYDLLKQQNVYVNRRWLTAFGYTDREAQAMGAELMQIFHPDDMNRIAANHDAWRTAPDGESRTIEYRIRDKQGGWHWLMSNETPFTRDESGLVSQILGIGHDITERKKSEQAFRESEELLRLTTEMSNIATWEYNAENNLMSRSANHDQLYGLPWQGNWHRETFLMATHPDDREPVNEIINAALAPGGPDYYAFDFRVIRPDKSLCWLWAKGQIAKRDPAGRGLLVRGILIDVTERKFAEARVQRLTQLYAALSQCNQAIVRCSNEAELLPQVCRDAVNFGGMQMAWVGMLNKTTKQIKPVASFGTGIQYLDGIEVSADANMPTGQGPVGISLRTNQPYWCQDFQHDPVTAAWHERGAEFGWGAIAALPLHRNGVAVGVFALYSGTVNAFDEAAQNLLIEMAMDISYALERFDTEAARRQEQAQLRKLSQVVEQSPNVILITDLEANIEYVNPAFVKTTGYSFAEVAGKNPSLLQSGRTPHTVYADMWAHLHNGNSWQGELINKRKDGSEYIESVYVSPMTETEGRITHYLGIKEDVTEQKRADERIHYLANFDSLTGLPNRIQLADHIKYALGLAKRNNEHLAVMFVDLDRFKDINDTLGHSVGDDFLIEVARRLKSVLREEDMVSRLGGDEFILILPADDANGAARVAQKLLQVVSERYRIRQYDLIVTASIGIALYPEDGEDLESLSRSADTAMYRAKQEGRAGYRFFTAEMQARATRNMQLVNALRYALELGQFRIFYQPQISIRDGRIIGVEALLRWRHPELGDVPPAEFIPVAEDSGMILPIGEWVLHKAVQQLKRWMDRGHTPMVMAVNLSAVQFRHASLPDLVASILDEAQLPPEYLELELTEGVAMHDPLEAIAVMNKLHERGIRMSIDDFGTGYSSLNYLKKFKVYKLKIDQSFVRDINTDQEDKAIVAAIISMAKSLGLKTIAEGVESAEQLAFLCEQGCDEAQGYYYSRALPAGELEAFILNHARD
ncbi:MAG: Diguanylate cyclase/phosphodiesterase with PAS/PAC and GAF sensor(S) [Candidatus Gallionella acididurans]|uniref:Diguanylate cyclase/phosphodiesterase with PAS/PAC and GAF sensor(S) n=1 Tax=Candidatus Gallionella acididurans TaxID=1796491 RepID=A0A139BUQ5_9PROT|nr:MAG: Diguanylate cyclase/phosphodiesterase with PAS/PAC and GAF sensor(S) [Candidatus Gallionella acididurans]